MKKLISKSIKSKWPILINGHLEESESTLQQTCTKDCITSTLDKIDGDGVAFCSHNLSYHKRIMGGYEIVICAVDIDGKSGKGKFPLTKSKFKQRKGKEEDIEEIFSNSLEIIQLIEATIDESRKQAIETLHEIDKWSGELNRLAYQLIKRHREKSFSQEFEESPNLHKSIFATSTLLKDSLDYLAITYNPEAAKRSEIKTDLHPLITKIATIINNSEARKINKHIKISGECHACITLYDSFKLIILSMLQNAVKYSISNNDILVRFYESNSHVEIEIESFGYLIDEDEYDLIFSKGYRGRNIPQKMPGYGIGLFVTKIVALANKIKISIQSKPSATQLNGNAVGTNTFKLTIKK